MGLRRHGEILDVDLVEVTMCGRPGSTYWARRVQPGAAARAAVAEEAEAGFHGFGSEER
jgi:hypothetical protein